MFDAVEDPDLMSELEQEKIVVFTPSRKVGGKRIVCYDDRYIVKLAAETDGVIVSNDTYRDLAAENADYRKATEERLLMYSFVNDRLSSVYLIYCHNELYSYAYTSFVWNILDVVLLFIHLGQLLYGML